MSVLMSPADSQRYLGVKRYQFDNLIRPNIPEVRIGRRVFFSREDLDSFVKKRKDVKKMSKKRGKYAPSSQPIIASFKVLRGMLNMT
jgi:hypothetical protein